jgi:hypothetical protein
MTMLTSHFVDVAEEDEVVEEDETPVTFFQVAHAQT